MLLNTREFKFLKNYRNVYRKSSAKREFRDENVFLKVDRALSKLNPPFLGNILWMNRMNSEIGYVMIQK